MATMALVGGQYGSEGKGVIAALLARGATCSVRTGGPNAGHSFNYVGRVWKMRSIPCAWVNPATLLLIGPGAVIDPVTLLAEVDALEGAGYKIRARLIVDERATVIIPDDHEAERSRLRLGSIGSTLEGVGAARIRRIERRLTAPETWHATDAEQSVWTTPADVLAGTRITVGDTVALAASHAAMGALILEGTQGFGLSLIHGYWPHVTSHDTTAAQLAADAGVDPITMREILVVFRSYPIRVGGPSGPMKNEMTWAELANKTGRPDLEFNPERTTVTNKIRRVGEFDWDLSRRAVMVNGATSQALTFADYIDPAVAGVRAWHNLTAPVRAMIDLMEEVHGIPVVFVGTGGPEWSVCVRPDQTLHHRGAGIGEIYPITPPS